MQKNPSPSGYLHPKYARSLAEFGSPRLLPHCGGWILQRQIGNTPYHDGMGCYPIFVCQDWQQLGADLDEISGDLVSLALVADSFGDHTLSSLQNHFDLVIPFKEHWVVDLQSPAMPTATRHHRYYARKALQKINVHICDQPSRMLNEWDRLYSHLTHRHSLQGIKRFSRSAFETQLQIPGLVMFIARSQVDDGKVVGAHLWYIQGDVAHSHLAALSPEGYALRSSYALYWRAIEHFRGTVGWLNLGAGAGLQHSADDGLTQFKRGWANCSRIAYFCGKIFHQKKYHALRQAKEIPATQYFPAYRHGEFA